MKEKNLSPRAHDKPSEHSAVRRGSNSLDFGNFFRIVDKKCSDPD